LHAADVIRRDPWKLLVKGFSSCGFNRCMRLYSDLGLPMNRLKVQTIACWYALHSDSSGSTWCPKQKAIDMLCAPMGAGVKLRPDKALRLGIRARWLSIKKDQNGDTWIAEHEKAMDEWRLAEKLKGKNVLVIPDPSGEKEAYQLARAVSGRVLEVPNKIDDYLIETQMTTNNFYSLIKQARKV